MRLIHCRKRVIIAPLKALKDEDYDIHIVTVYAPVLVDMDKVPKML